MRVLVLGAGFGGLELTTRLSDEFGDAVEIVLIDKAEGFAFGFSRLDVMFGRLVPDAVIHPYRDLVKPGVRFVQTTIRSIDPGQRRVETEAGSFDADVMVVALGADLDPAATPGLVEGGYEFYSMPGALAVRDALAAFDGGRVVVGVTSTPFKCPPAPSEVALLMHDYLTDRGRRDRSEISLVTPLGAPIPLFQQPPPLPAPPVSPHVASRARVVGRPGPSAQCKYLGLCRTISDYFLSKRYLTTEATIFICNSIDRYAA